jgi:hypothetical protein
MAAHELTVAASSILISLGGGAAMTVGPSLFPGYEVYIFWAGMTALVLGVLGFGYVCASHFMPLFKRDSARAVKSAMAKIIWFSIGSSKINTASVKGNKSYGFDDVLMIEVGDNGSIEQAIIEDNEVHAGAKSVPEKPNGGGIK